MKRFTLHYIPTRVITLEAFKLHIFTFSSVLMMNNYTCHFSLKTHWLYLCNSNPLFLSPLRLQGMKLLICASPSTSFA